MSVPPVRSRRWLIVTLLVLLLGGVALAAAFFAAAQMLKGRIGQALGADAEVARIALGWNGVAIEGLRLPAPRSGGWPAADQLRAARVVVVPQLRDLLSGSVRIASVTVEGGYLSLLRTRDGRLSVLPGLLEPATRAQRTGAAPAIVMPPIEIGEIRLAGAAIELFDATVRKPPHKLRLERIDATLADLRLPALTGASRLAVDGIVKGVRQDGRLQLDGRVEFATRELDLTLRLHDVDLVALQPYLIKASETGVRRGTLDLALHSTVQRRRLHAPGRLVLSGLELAPGASTFMGMPQQLVVAALKNRKDRIEIEFALDGDLDDPRFSINESLAVRVAAAVAESLGVSIESLVRGVGSLGGGAVKGLGDALGGLLAR